MGGSQGKTKDKSSQSMIPPPNSLQAIRSKLRPLSTYQDQDVDDYVHRTLDTSLKGFLRACNMKGLEYRLRLAGVYTLEDLVEKDEAALTHHGFTQLMARRLFRSLEDYLSGPEVTPFMVVRPNRRLSTGPSIIMRSSHNYGKINKKRSSMKSKNRSSSKRNSSRRSNHTQNQERPKKMSTPLPMVKVVRVKPSASPLSEENELPVGNDDTDSPSTEEEERLPSFSTPSPSPIPSPSPVPSFDIPTIHRLLSMTPINLERCISNPCNLSCYHDNDDDASPWQPLRRGTSCPDIDFHDDTETVKSIMEDAVLVLRKEGKLNEVSCALYSLLDGYKSDHSKGVDSLEVVRLVGRSLSSLSAEVDVAEVGCRVMKYATHDLLETQGVEIEAGSLSVMATTVLHVMKYHAHSKRVQLNASLTLSNLVRLDSSLNSELLNGLVLPHLSSSLVLFEDDETVTSGVLSLLSMVAASAPDARQSLVSDFQPTLKQAGHIIDMYLSSNQILEYSLSFIALALIDVAPQLDGSVMRSLTTSVLQVLEDNAENATLVVWGCKIMAQVSSHEIVQDRSLAKTMVDRLLKCLSLHSTSPSVQTWASYALYQLASFNSAVLPLIQGRGCIEQCQAAMPHLDQEAQSYLEQFTKLATL